MYETQSAISNIKELYQTGRFQQAWDLLRREFDYAQIIADPLVGIEAARLLSMFGWVGCSRRLVRVLRERHPAHKLVELRWVNDRLQYGDYDPVIDWLHQARDVENWPAESRATFWATGLTSTPNSATFSKRGGPWIAPWKSTPRTRFFTATGCTY
jgi:hypothetical protein